MFVCNTKKFPLMDVRCLTRTNTFILTFIRNYSETVSISERNIAVVLKNLNTADVLERPIPEVKGKEVLVKMGFVQLGRSDLQLSTLGTLRGKRIVRDWNIDKGFILGSLGTGTVVYKGSDVLGDIEIGDRVALEPRIHCGNCLACRERKYHMCKFRFHAGIPPKDGMLQKYYNHPWQLCHILPEGVGLLEGSYCTTVAFCIQAYKTSGASRKTHVLIIGGGMAGACLVKIFTSLGCKSIIVIDVFNRVLGPMKNLGANFVINTKVTCPPVEVVDEIIRHCQGGMKSDIVIDTVQSWATARIVAKVIKMEGRVVLFDHPSHPSDFNYVRYMDDTNKILHVIELNSYGEEFKNAIHFLNQHQDLCETIPPYEVPLEKGTKGFTIARSKLCSKPCVVIKCNK